MAGTIIIPSTIFITRSIQIEPLDLAGPQVVINVLGDIRGFSIRSDGVVVDFNRLYFSLGVDAGAVRVRTPPGETGADSVSVTFAGCTFSGGSASRGAAIRIDESRTNVVTIENCFFENAVSSDISGGAVRVTTSGTVTEANKNTVFILNSVFVNCDSNLNGGTCTTTITPLFEFFCWVSDVLLLPLPGAVAVNGDLTVTNSNFTGNTANNDGGGACSNTVFCFSLTHVPLSSLTFQLSRPLGLLPALKCPTASSMATRQRMALVAL